MSFLFLSSTPSVLLSSPLPPRPAKKILYLMHKEKFFAGLFEGLIRRKRNRAKRENRFPASGWGLFVVNKKRKVNSGPA